MTDAAPGKEKRSHSAATAAIAAAIIVCAAAAYVYCYLHMPVAWRTSGPPLRRYEYRPVAMLFVPAAWIEAKLTRQSVTVESAYELPAFSYTAEP